MERGGKMKFYAIRHKASGELMPEMARRGYSFWNPSCPQPLYGAKESIRLFKDKKRAERCITAWSIGLQYKSRFYSMYDGISEEETISKDDGRKKDDLEVVKVTLSILK